MSNWSLVGYCSLENVHVTCNVFYQFANRGNTFIDCTCLEKGQVDVALKLLLAKCDQHITQHVQEQSRTSPDVYESGRTTTSLEFPSTQYEGREGSGYARLALDCQR